MGSPAGPARFGAEGRADTRPGLGLGTSSVVAPSVHSLRRRYPAITHDASKSSMDKLLLLLLLVLVLVSWNRMHAHVVLRFPVYACTHVCTRRRCGLSGPADRDFNQQAEQCAQK